MGAERAILLVDDEINILNAMRRELRSEFGSSCRYEIALSAEEGLVIFDELAAERIKVVLVISDWLMPGMKGDVFIARVREFHPDVKTIMLSGQADEGQLDKIKDSGALDLFMRKPWDHERLMAECHRLISEG